MTDREFGPELFSFLRELKEHNDREWFAANKHRYEDDLLEPALAFIEDFGLRLPDISPHLVADARRQGGSLFRIYRDTRFAKDKSPYKTTAGIYFRHERSKEAYSPGLYLHLAPRDVFAGGGIWHADTKTAHAIRQQIVKDPEAWSEAKAGIELAAGESLKRVPPAFDKDHEHARRPAPQGLRRHPALHPEGGDDRRLPRPLRGGVPVVHAAHAVPLPCREGARTRSRAR